MRGAGRCDPVSGTRSVGWAGGHQAVRYSVHVRQWLLDIAKAILPDRFIEWYRRRRAARRYIEALGYEIYDREIRLELEDLEGRVAARRAGFSQRIIKDILERTDVVLQGLDRKIEGASARHGRSLRELQAQVEALRADLVDVRAQLESMLADQGGPDLQESLSQTVPAPAPRD
jgi:hypothetical protein